MTFIALLLSTITFTYTFVLALELHSHTHILILKLVLGMNKIFHSSCNVVCILVDFQKHRTLYDENE